MALHTTTDELEMIRDYIILPKMIEMCERSLTETENSGNILRSLHSKATLALMTLINAEIMRIRREFKVRRIRVHDAEDQRDLTIYCRYNVRGYEEEFGIFRETAKTQISVQLSKYISALVQPLKGIR